jgi:hypothetical protein
LDSKQNRPTDFGTAADRVKTPIYPAFGTAADRSDAMAPGAEPIKSDQKTWRRAIWHLPS